MSCITVKAEPQKTIGCAASVVGAGVTASAVDALKGISLKASGQGMSLSASPSLAGITCRFVLVCDVSSDEYETLYASDGLLLTIDGEKLRVRKNS